MRLPHSFQESATDAQYFQSKRTGLWLYHRAWWPVGQPRALVFLSHGFGEHCSRGGYAELGGFLILPIYSFEHFFIESN